jgi:hypothetical protein
VIENEPELITILEGPTPDFRPSPYLWFQSVYEGPEDADIVMCEMRTLNGEDIVKRCRKAWAEGRLVQLDYPDYLRMRQQLNVVAMRLREVEEGLVLLLWLQQPFGEFEGEEFDGEEDDSDY